MKRHTDTHTPETHRYTEAESYGACTHLDEDLTLSGREKLTSMNPLSKPKTPKKKLMRVKKHLACQPKRRLPLHQMSLLLATRPREIYASIPTL